MLSHAINFHWVANTFTADQHEFVTSMSVLLIVGPKSTLAASHDASGEWWVTVIIPTGKMDGRTGRQTVTLRFPPWTRPAY